MDHRAHRVQSLVELGRYAEARDAVRSLLAEQPDDPVLLGLLAQALLGLDDDRGALEVGNRLVGVAPEEEYGHRICSIALLALKIPQGAVAAAAEAVRLAPLSHRTHVQYAMAALGIPSLLQDARAAAFRAAELGPHDADAHFVIGLVHEALHQPDTARQAYRRALALEPGHTAAQNNLTLLDSRFRLRSAARGFATALSHDPQASYVHQNLDLLAYRFARRIYWVALVTLVVGIGVGVATNGDTGRVGWPGVALGCLMVAAVAGYTAVLVRDVPVGVRRHVSSRLVRNPFLLVTSLLTLLMLATAVTACFAPYGALLAVALLQPLGLLNVGVFVWGMARNHSRL